MTGDGLFEAVDANGDGEIAFFDPMFYLFLDDGSLGADDLIASNDDSGQTYGDGSISSVDPYLSLFLNAGSYLVAIGATHLDLSEALAGFNDETLYPVTCTLTGVDCVFAETGHGDYRISLVVDTAAETSVPEPNSLALLALGLVMLARRRFTYLAGAIALLCAPGAIACSLQFTSPGDGVTVMSPTVGVSGTGTGTANSGDMGTVTPLSTARCSFNVAASSPRSSTSSARAQPV